MQSIHSILLIGGIIGFAVGIIVATLLLVWREKRILKKLDDIIGTGWKVRLEGIREWLTRGNEASIQDASFLLQVIGIIRKD